MSKLRTTLAGAAMATALAGSLAGFGATGASASTEVATQAPVVQHQTHKGKCIWISRTGKVHKGWKHRKTTVVWKNGHFYVKRYWGCNIKRKWWW
ncbi:hypothetical protein ACIBG7_39095 [Nonomuraea sp. NPDC050328]|uniref:hypothetical protein n=1 Tax=Nonomuraea sp. NPDC050328 TaxID=3364361 RepID=UPI00379E6151